MFELLLQADEALAQGSLDEAAQLYSQLLALDPANAIAMAGLARIALERGDTEQARILSEKALAMDPHAAFAARVIQALEHEGKMPEQPEILDQTLIAFQRMEGLGKPRRNAARQAPRPIEARRRAQWTGEPETAEAHASGDAFAAAEAAAAVEAIDAFDALDENELEGSGSGEPQAAMAGEARCRSMARWQERPSGRRANARVWQPRARPRMQPARSRTRQWKWPGSNRQHRLPSRSQRHRPPGRNRRLRAELRMPLRPRRRRVRRPATGPRRSRRPRMLPCEKLWPWFWRSRRSVMWPTRAEHRRRPLLPRQLPGTRGPRRSPPRRPRRLPARPPPQSPPLRRSASPRRTEKRDPRKRCG